MRLLFAVAMIAVVLSARTNAFADGFLRAEGTKLLLDGKEYRAIGVNVPHLPRAIWADGLARTRR